MSELRLVDYVTDLRIVPQRTEQDPPCCQLRLAVDLDVDLPDQCLGPEVISSVWSFLAIFFGLAGLMALWVAAGGYGLDTAVSAGLTSLGNVGPGLGEIGPYDQFGHFPSSMKLGFVFCMLAGRLELFTLLVLLSPAFWRR